MKTEARNDRDDTRLIGSVPGLIDAASDPSSGRGRSSRIEDERAASRVESPLESFQWNLLFQFMCGWTLSMESLHPYVSFQVSWYGLWICTTIYEFSLVSR